MNNLQTIFSEYGLNLSEQEASKLMLFGQILEEENKLYNLTRLTGEDLLYKHFLDSGILTNFVRKGKLLDIGSGAGFPGLVLAILGFDVTLVEATRKKALFLEKVVKALELKVKVINDRVENLKDFNSFDYATARGVAKLGIIMRYAIPFLKISGIFLAQKGPNYEEEIDNKLFKQLSCTLDKVEKYSLPNCERVVLLIRKNLNDRVRL